MKEKVYQAKFKVQNICRRVKDTAAYLACKLGMCYLIAIFTLLCVTGVTVADMIYTFHGSSVSPLNMKTMELDIDALFTYSSGTTSVSFSSNKVRKGITANLTNNNDAPVTYYYVLSYEGAGNTDLARDVYVYYDDKYVGTAAQLVAAGTHLNREFSLIEGMSSASDVISFELHNSYDTSHLDDKTLNIKVTAFSESAQHKNYIYVSDSNEFEKAVDDVNSGLLPENIIVLTSNINLNDGNTNKEIVFENSCLIQLNGHTLSGDIELDGSDVLLDVEDNDNTGMNATVTLTDYDVEGAMDLVTNRIRKYFGREINSLETKNLLGTLSFYVNEIVTSGFNYTYSSGNITAGNMSETTVEKVTVKLDSSHQIVWDFKILGSIEALAAEYLSYIPTDGITEVTGDLYLPTAIKEKNATITWVSENPEVMNDEGVIVAESSDHSAVKLIATIKVNKKVYTREFLFKVSARSNEINFNMLIAEMSPLVIYYVNNNSHPEYTTYFLPTVGGTYDYRLSYTSPMASSSYPLNPTYTWEGFKDIGLESITYTLPVENGEPVYDYINLREANGNVGVILNNYTPNTYAQITVTGTFSEGESYTSIINVDIATGKNTELMEATFKLAEDDLSNVDILENILSTRKANGIGNEKGDFSLPARNEGYTITYATTESSQDIIDSITYDSVNDEYDFAINPEYFPTSDSMVAINCTVTYAGDISTSRILYFEVPGAIHTKDLGNATIFNSVKYQVVNGLPADEKTGSTGFTTSGTMMTNNTGDYILLRDIKGDGVYEGTKALTLNVPSKANMNTLSYSDKYGYDLAALIQWATGTSNNPAQSVVNNTALLGSLGTTSSNGKEYLDENEVAVIREFYMNATGVSSSEFDDVWASVTETPNGYLIFDTVQINEVINYEKDYVYGGSLSTLYFKYVEMLQWADNEKDHDETYQGYHLVIPNMQIVGKCEWTIGDNSTGAYFRDAKGNYWIPTSKGSNGYQTGKYINTSNYAEDNTEYISDIEAEIVKVYLLNMMLPDNGSLTNVNNDTDKAAMKNIVDGFDSALVKPTFFNGDGIGNFVNKFYEDAGIAVGGESGFDSYYNTYPMIFNLDGIGAGLNYFSKLESLSIQGTGELCAFLSNTLLGQFFARVTNNNSLLESLTMEYCAGELLDFDVESTKLLDNLTYIDYSNNPGIKDVSVLVNVNRDNYTYVDIYAVGADLDEDFGEEYDFVDYAVSNLSSNTCSVYYTKDGVRTLYSSGAQATGEVLSKLSSFNRIISEKMFATDRIYNDNGTQTDICWRIEEGNEIGPDIITAGGDYPDIETYDKMNALISPYYVCNETFTFDGHTYTAGKVYKFSAGTDGAITVTQVQSAEGTDMTISNIYSDINAIPTSVSEENIVADSNGSGPIVRGQYTPTNLFEGGTWYDWEGDGGEGTVTHNHGNGTATITNEGNQRWSLQLYNEMENQMTEGHSYTIEMDLYCDTNARIWVDIESRNNTESLVPGRPATVDITGGQVNHIVLVTNSATNIFEEYAKFVIMLGNGSGNTGKVITYSNMILTDNDSAAEIAAGYQTQNEEVSVETEVGSLTDIYNRTTAVNANATINFNATEFVYSYNSNYYIVYDNNSNLGRANGARTITSFNNNQKFALLTKAEAEKLDAFLADPATYDGTTFGIPYTDMSTATSTSFYIYNIGTGRYLQAASGTNNLTLGTNRALYRAVSMGNNQYKFLCMSAASNPESPTNTEISNARGIQLRTGYTNVRSNTNGNSSSFMLGPNIVSGADTGTRTANFRAPRIVVTTQGTDGDETNVYTAYYLGYKITKNTITTVTTQRSLINGYTTNMSEYVGYTGANALRNNMLFRQNSVLKNSFEYFKGKQYTRSKTDVDEEYSVEFWYSDTIDGEKRVVPGEVKSIFYPWYGIVVNNGQPTTSTPQSVLTGNSFSENDIVGVYGGWTLVSDGSSWIGTNKLENYINYVNFSTTQAIGSQKLSDRKELITDIHSHSNLLDEKYRFADEVTSGDIYVQSLTTPITIAYEHNGGYKMGLNANGLYWSYTENLGEPVGVTTMDEILDEANLHFGDCHYGEYYGKYYALSLDEAILTANGNTYRSGDSIYRIMPNANNDAFTFEYIKPFTAFYYDNGETYANPIDRAMMLILSGAVTEQNVGDVYYLKFNTEDTGANRTYYSGFYIMTYNEDAGSYFLKHFEDVTYKGFEFGGNSVNYFYNERIYHTYDYEDNTNFYGGTGGTIPTVISAVIRQRQQDGSYVEYVRHYKVDVVG